MDLSKNAQHFIDLNRKIERVVKSLSYLSFREEIMSDCHSCIIKAMSGYEPTSKDIQECYNILEVFCPKENVKYLAAS